MARTRRQPPIWPGRKALPCRKIRCAMMHGSLRSTKYTPRLRRAAHPVSISDVAPSSIRHARITVSLCFLAAMCEGFDVQAAGVAAAGLRAEFGPSPFWLGIVFAASGAGLLLGAVAGGRLADRIGRKPVLVGSLAAFGLFSLLTTLVGNIQSLSAMRLVTGLGLGGAMPNLIALTADVAASRSRNGSIAVTYVGMPIGAAIAGLISSGIALESWRTIFLCGGIAPLV